MGSNQRVLYVGEDGPDRLRRVGTLEGRGFEVLTSTTARDGLLRIHTDRIDCVVCDGTPPDMSLIRFYDLIAEELSLRSVLVVGELDDIESNGVPSGLSIQYVPDEWGLGEVVEETIMRGHLGEAISEHQRLLAAIHAIALELVDTASPEEVHRLVYDRMIALDRYQFAWIGEYCPEEFQLELDHPSSSTLSPDQFATMMGATEPDFIEQAVDYRSVVTATASATTRGAAATASATEATPKPTTTEPQRSPLVAVAVPFVYDESVYGLLLLSSTPEDDGGLASSERDLLAGLGRLVGWALANIDTEGGLDVGTFADIVVHELVNPLSVAMAAVETAKETNGTEHLATIERALDRIEHVVTDELSLLRGAEIDSQTFADIATGASNAWTDLETEGAELTIDASKAIRADHRLLESLLTNLFDNALSYAGDSAHVRIGALPDGFYVSDNGPGIPHDVKPQIFEFGYSNHNGTGLGLAIVKEIVEAHGWTIRVADGEEGGARFEITGVETR